jgi:lipoprotein signal peptidase
VILLAGLAFVADEGTKALAWHLIPVYPYSRGAWLIRPFLLLQHREHMGWYGAEDAIKVVLCPMVIVVLARADARSSRRGLDRFARVVLVLFLTGVTCNAFDRLSHRSVTDFIGVRLPSELTFTNLADLYLFLGYGLFPVLLVLFTARAWRRKSSGRVRVMRQDERPG